MNVTVEDIRKIKPGYTVEFNCDSNEAIKSAQSLVGYCNKIKKPKSVWKYISKGNFEDKTITITAISSNGVHSEEK